MEKYRRVRGGPREKEPLAQNEVRVSTKGSLDLYVAYAKKKVEEDGERSLKVTAIGNCIPKGIVVAEIVKRHIKGMHQLARIGTTKIVDLFEPKEEGLDPVEDVRLVSSIEIDLSLDSFDTKDGHYQEPIGDDMHIEDQKASEDLIKSAAQAFRLPKKGKGKGKRGKGKGRGRGRGDKSGKDDDDESESEESEREEEKSKSRRRQRGGKGKGKRGGKRRSRKRSDDDDDDDSEDDSPRDRRRRDNRSNNRRSDDYDPPSRSRGGKSKGKGKKGKGKGKKGKGKGKRRDDRDE